MSTSTVEREEKPAFDPTKLPLLERVTRTVKEPWGHDELKSKVYEHDQLQRKIDGEEEALKTYASNKRNEIKELEEERKLLSHSMTDGMYVDVACEIRVDIEAGTKIVLRSDTLEVISETKLTDKDRQMALDLSATNDVFETMKQALKDGMGKDPAPVDVELEVVATADEIVAGVESIKAKATLKKTPKPDSSVPSMPSSRIMRSKSKADQKGRWKSASFWKAHDAGLLDPQEDDLTRALVDIGEGGLSDVAMAALETDLDAFEQDCIAEIEEDAKAQAKLDAGKYPTGQVKVDVAIGEVRWQRAKLDVAMSAVPA